MHAETYSASIDDLAAREEAANPAPDLIELAMSKLDSDPGALFERDVLAALVEVRQTDPAQYARVRAAAKVAKAGVGELDKLTAPKDDGGSLEVFTDVEPWPEPVACRPGVDHRPACHCRPANTPRRCPVDRAHLLHGRAHGVAAGAYLRAGDALWQDGITHRNDAAGVASLVDFQHHTIGHFSQRRAMGAHSRYRRGRRLPER
jgi:hypothetical protein